MDRACLYSEGIWPQLFSPFPSDFSLRTLTDVCELPLWPPLLAVLAKCHPQQSSSSKHQMPGLKCLNSGNAVETW